MLVHLHKTRWHLAITLLFLFLPVAFFIIFSSVARLGSLALLQDVFISTLRLFVAYVLALVLGWGLALLFCRGTMARVALPIFDVLQSFPTFAALPLAVAAWGESDVTVVVFLLITIVWPIFFSVTSTMQRVPRDWQEAAHVYHLRGWRYVKSFLLPASYPGAITGSIIGLGEGWEALVATEIIVGSQQGLGNFFQIFSQNITMTFFGILGFLLLIFSLNKIVWLPLLERSHRHTVE